MPDIVRRRLWPHVSRPVRNALLWLVGMGLVALVGAFGYMIIEGWDFFDSIYMTIGVLATLGLKEIHPMDRPGELWTMFLSILGVAIILSLIHILAIRPAHTTTGHTGYLVFARRLAPGVKAPLRRCLLYTSRCV